MRKNRLVTPGPMMAPPEALLELARPVIHHRTPETKALMSAALDGLKKVLVTKNDVVILTSSGTGAMEAAVANFVGRQDKAIVLTAGKFGERWVDLCRAYGAETIVVEEPYGKAIPPERAAAALKEHPDCTAVYCTLSETSTGVAHDIEAIGKIVARTEALFAVDGISGVGAVECRTDDWHIDLLAVGSQKALMLPPGLAFLSVSGKAKQRLERGDAAPAFYFDLKKALKSAAEADTPFTPAHTLVAALVVCLQQILEDGIEQVWRRTATLSRSMSAAAQALGVQTLAERPAAGLTAFVAPAGVDASRWSKLLESKYGLKVAGGQGSLKGKIIRIAHMGYMDAIDVVGIVAALEWSLAELGHPVEIGKAVAAATRALAGDLVS